MHEAAKRLYARDRIVAGVEKLRFFPLALESGEGSWLVEQPAAAGCSTCRRPGPRTVWATGTRRCARPSSGRRVRRPEQGRSAPSTRTPWRWPRNSST